MNDYIQGSPRYSIAVIILLYLPICCAWYYLQFWAPTGGLRVYHPKIEEIILLSASKQQSIVLIKKGKIKCSLNFLKFFHYQLTNQDFCIQSQICINTMTNHENATGNAHYHTQRLSEVTDSAKGRNTSWCLHPTMSLRSQTQQRQEGIPGNDTSWHWHHYLSFSFFL